MNDQFDTPENRKRFALGLIAVGVFFVLNQWLGFFNPAGSLWPFFVILPGAAFLYFAFTGDKNNAGLVFPGAIITGTGLILLYQNLTGDWDSWAYVWTLYPAMVGFGLRYNGERNNHSTEVKTGNEMMKWSFIAFAIGFVVFELVIFNGFGNFGVILIAAGALWLFFSQNRAKEVGYTSLNGSAKLKRKHDEEIRV